MRRPATTITLLLTLIIPPSLAAAEYLCPPTPPDADGPFYRPGAPVRNRIGSGYLLDGAVKSAVDCSPLRGATIEIWMAGPDGIYADRWRATVFPRSNGRYYFVSHFPGPYGSRPPHIHLRVAAPGFEELFTQHYPVPGQESATFDLVLVPAP